MTSMRYYTTLTPGLENVAWQDIQNKLEDVKLQKEDKGRLLFSYSGGHDNLLRLRSVDDVYINIGEITGLTRSRNSLGDIYRRTTSFDLESALKIHKEAHGGKGKKKITFRVVSTMKGRHNFRRIDAQQSVQTAFEQKYGWRFSLDSPTLEFRMDLEEDKVLLGLRLTDERINRKRYKTAHVPGSLNPTVAYCMALLSEPKATDIFVDPMCGAGTIVIERAFSGPYNRIIGGDMDEDVVLSAKNNVISSHRSLDLMQWSVPNIPIRDKSVSKIVCNLPFGKQTGSKPDNQSLYSSFFREADRIMMARGKMVIMTTEKDMVMQILAKYRQINLRNLIRIDLLGTKAYICVANFI